MYGEGMELFVAWSNYSQHQPLPSLLQATGCWGRVTPFQPPGLSHSLLSQWQWSCCSRLLSLWARGPRDFGAGCCPSVTGLLWVMARNNDGSRGEGAPLLPGAWSPAAVGAAVTFTVTLVTTPSPTSGARTPTSWGLLGAIGAHIPPPGGQNYHGISTPRCSAHLVPKAAADTPFAHPLSGAAHRPHRVPPMFPVEAVGVVMSVTAAFPARPSSSLSC